MRRFFQSLSLPKRQASWFDKLTNRTVPVTDPFPLVAEPAEAPSCWSLSLPKCQTPLKRQIRCCIQ